MLKSKRNKLLNYMKDKSDFLEEITNIKLYIDKDYDYIKTLSYKDVKEIFDKMRRKTISNNSRLNDSDICPQCIIKNIFNYISCYECDYAANHIICEYIYSTYNKINIKLETSITKEIKVENLIKYFKWNK